MERNVYLETIDVTDVDEVIKTAISDAALTYQTEQVSLKSAPGRVTAKEVIAKLSSPYYNASAMDGIAVISKETEEASETNPVLLKNYAYVNTGNPIEDPYDAVIMIEDILEEETGVKIIKPASIWQHLRPIGEDIVQGELVLPRFRTIRSTDLSALVGAGITKVEVFRRPRVAIVPTGSEIITDPEKIEVGKILDSNSYYLEAAAKELGATVELSHVMEDELEPLKQAVLELSNHHDVILIGAGTSAGSKDYTKKIIEDLGEIYIHGINIKPGKPTLIGRIGGCIIVGLPGYPVSTWMAFETVVKPLLYQLQHKDAPPLRTVQAKLSKKIYSSLKHHEYVRVKLGKVNNELICIPLERGAAISMSLVKADGILMIPKSSEGFDAGVVDVLLFEQTNIEQNIVSIGSHDLMMDYVNDALSEYGFELSSTHVGSMGGVIAMKRGECHIAPVHLLENGVYNSHLIEKYQLNAVLVKGPKRVQGIAVKKGNPKGIQNLHDLPKVSFINRQRGSGTRILLDYLLSKEQIDPESIHGYDYELTTHMTVVSAVESGKGDAGMCVKSVALMKDVDFIPIGEEEYDFLVQKSFIGTPMFEQFIAVLKNKSLQDRLLDEGYSVNDMGKIEEV